MKNERKRKTLLQSVAQIDFVREGEEFRLDWSESLYQTEMGNQVQTELVKVVSWMLGRQDISLLCNGHMSIICLDRQSEQLIF